MALPMIVRRVVKTETEVDGLGGKIKQAQVESGKNIEQVIREVGISRTYWNNLVKEKTDGIAYDLLKKLESALAVDFGVNFE